MDYVPSLAAVAAAAQKSPHVEAATVAATNAVSPVASTALDPRPTYALNPGAADAMLALAGSRTQAAVTVEFETQYGHASRVAEVSAAAASAPVVAPEPTKAVSAANRNWNEDVRLDHIPTRKIGPIRSWNTRTSGSSQRGAQRFQTLQAESIVASRRRIRT